MLRKATHPIRKPESSQEGDASNQKTVPVKLMGATSTGFCGAINSGSGSDLQA